jgi:F-type H+-transporting ATPase subunit b
MRRARSVVLSGGAWVLATAPAFADSMPQMQFGNKLLQAQVVWGAIIFAGFYWAVSQIGLPRVAGILEMRAASIARDLNSARDARAESDRAVRELNEARKKAYAQSQAAINEALQRAKDDAARRAAEQDAKLQAQLGESERQIEAARAAAMGALREAATDTAGALVGRLLGRPAEPGAVQAAVSQALHERGLAA